MSSVDTYINGVLGLPVYGRLFSAGCLQRSSWRLQMYSSFPPSNLQKKKKKNAMRASRDGNRALRSARQIASAL